MKKAIFLTLLMALLLTVQVHTAEPGNKKPMFVVTAGWLAKHIDDKDLVLLHVGRQEDFDKEHIPGAQYISTRDISTTKEENPLTLELPAVDRLVEKFESLGISNRSRIVIYWGEDWVTPATRVFFTLDYLGLADRTSILDGGMPAWKSAGNGLTAEVTKPQRGKLEVVTRDLVAKKAELIDAILNDKPIAIVDARSPKYYTGEDKGSMPRAGHIPNAQNIPYSSLVTEENKFKGIKELQALFDKAGVRKEEPVVTYCHIGQQASLAYFVARMLGYKVRIYDGSFQEWSNSEERVVVEEATKDAEPSDQL